MVVSGTPSRVAEDPQGEVGPWAATPPPGCVCRSAYAHARVSPRRNAMATYVLLTKVTAAGVKTLHSNPRRIKEVNKDVEALGARVVAQYATLGRYDFVNIVEAKDNETIARLSVALGARGTVQIETLTAIPVETFIRGLATKPKGRSSA